MKRSIISPIAAGLIILLFTYASVSKLLAFEKFVREINNQPLPNSWTPYLTKAIIAIEVGIIILLCFVRTQRLGFLISAAFLSLFTVYTIIVLAGGFSYLPCSCGGIIEKLSWPQHLVLNLSSLILALIGFYNHPNRRIPKRKMHEKRRGKVEIRP